MNILNPFPEFQCGFKRRYSSQHCLLCMIKKFRKIRENESLFAAVLRYLFEAFDCIYYSLLTAKLKDYGFGKNRQLWYLVFSTKEKKNINK